MARARCWSSIVAGPADRAALRMDPQASWLLSCDLPEGHAGFHASDGGRGGLSRRRWLLWSDYASAPQDCRELEPCRGRSIDGAACTLFEGHDGLHRFPAVPPSQSFRAQPLSREFPAPVGHSPTPRTPTAPKPPTPPGAGESLSPMSWPGTPSPVTSAAPLTPRPPVTPAPQEVEMSRNNPPETPKAAAGSGHKAKDPKPTKNRKAKGDKVSSATDRALPETPALTSMIEINDYADLSRTSFIEVIDTDGSSRTVVAPVSVANAPSPRTSAPPVRITGSLSELEAATAASNIVSAAAQMVTAMPEDQSLVRRQVGDALRDVAQALAKLADSLDPR